MAQKIHEPRFIHDLPILYIYILLVNFVYIILDPDLTWKIIVLRCSIISLLSPCYISTISPVSLPRYSFSRKGRRAVSRFADSCNQPLQPWKRHSSTISHDRLICRIQDFHGLSICCQFYIILSIVHQFLHPIFTMASQISRWPNWTSAPQG